MCVFTVQYFLGGFEKFQKAIISFIVSVCPFVRPSVRLHGTTHLSVGDFYEILYMRIFRKSVEKIEVWLRSDKNNEYFT
jgi:hypothetical protein